MTIIETSHTGTVSLELVTIGGAYMVRSGGYQVTGALDETTARRRYHQILDGKG